MENSIEFLKKNFEKNYHKIQQFHFCTYIQKNWKQGLEEVFAHSCSLHCYSQKPRGSGNLNVHQQMNGKESGVYTSPKVLFRL